MHTMLRGARRLRYAEPAAGRVTVILALCLALAGCASEPVPIPTGISPAPADLLAPLPPLVMIPVDEGNPDSRRRYYATTRQLYGQCTDRVAGLQAYARTVAPSSLAPATPLAGSRPPARPAQAGG
ncbi:MAG: hypothetical protein AB7L90_21170 [Hyphomicrobiaceae bacterium]